jgi:opacity protein-like surface antigen
MNWIQTVTRYVGISVMALVTSTALNVSGAYAETYVGGQFGMALPSIGGGLTNVEINAFSPPVSIPDRPLKSSPLYGVKFGYYFPQIRWFGLETELYNTTPHMKQQQTTVTIPAGTTIPGLGTTQTGGTIPANFGGNHFRVLTWAPVNFMFRYHKTRLQPYIGVGPGVFFARVNVTQQGFENSQSNTRLGLNAKAGVEYFITRRLTAFGEWKYNYAQFNFDQALGIKADYNMHLVAIGLSYHF